MINIKINDKSYEISSCTESKTWDNGKTNAMIFINFPNVQCKEYFDSLIGKNINAEILDEQNCVLYIGKDYILTEVNRCIPFNQGFSIRFEKNVSQ